MNAEAAALGQRLLKAESATLIWSEPTESGPTVVKMYRHRPLHDPLRRLLVPYRAEREYGILRRLERCGVDCTPPLYWTHGRRRPHGLYECLATREIAGAVALDALLRTAGGPPALAPLFALARRMHACGVVHGALFPRNVVVTGGAERPRFHLLDFAHGRIFGRDVAGTRPADFDLLDLLAALAREARLVPAEEWLAGYGLGPAGARRLLARLPAHRLRRPWRHFRRIETDARALLSRLSAPAAGT